MAEPRPRHASRRLDPRTFVRAFSNARSAGLKCKAETPRHDIAVRSHGHVLGSRMDVADRSLQGAGFEYGSRAGVRRDLIDDADRGFGGVSASGTKKGAGLD